MAHYGLTIVDATQGSFVWRQIRDVTSSLYDGLHEKPDQDLEICEHNFSEWFCVEMAQSKILL